MLKTKLTRRICWVIVLAVLTSALICCFTACDSFGSGIVNIEGCQKQLVAGDLSGANGIITDLQTVKQNRDVFENALSSSNVLIPERDSDSNVLAWQLLGFAQDEAILYPIYLFNEVDKSQVDYAELVNDDRALLSRAEKDYVYSSRRDNQNAMSLLVSYCVYVKNYLGKYHRAGMIKIKVAFYYFPTDDATYDHYISRLETTVIPTSKYTLKSFDMTPMTLIDNRMEDNKTLLNPINRQLPNEWFEFDTCIQYKHSYGYEIDKDAITLNEGGYMTLKFNTPVYEKRGVANATQRWFVGTEREGYDDYWGFISTVSRYCIGETMTLPLDKGKAYTGVCYKHYRAFKEINDVGINFLIDNLSLWGQTGEPSYKGGYDNYIFISLAGSHEFTSKSITMKSGTNNQSDAIAASSYILA